MARARTPAKRKPPFTPITFITVEQAFSPQVKVRANHDVNGWADRKKRIKWNLPAGQIGYMDAATAREFHTKGYVQIMEGDYEPVSDDEAAEMLSTVTTLSLGGPNG